MNFYEKLATNFDDLTSKQLKILLPICLLIFAAAVIGLVLVPDPMI